MTVKLLGISGSLRAGSFNTALLRVAAQQAAAQGITLDVVTLQGIPLYDGDAETASGVPAAAEALKARVMASDGVILATPEYNSGVPAVLKNAIDWLSRPYTDIPKVFGGRPFAVAGATPSPGGTLMAQTAWLPTLRHLGTHVFTSGRLIIGKAHELVDADGNFVDDATVKAIGSFVNGFSLFATALRKKA